VGDQSVELVLQAWEDDPGWATRTGDLLGEALPMLRRDIGLAWPLAEPLVVAESVSRDAGTYAGVFDPGEARMEVAYWAGPGVLIHQVAHAWFNASLLADRWADEGFATFYALRAAAELDIAITAPVLSEEVAASALPLNAWTRDEAPGSAVDTYGYAASLALATALAERVGTDGLADAWADAQGRVGAYQPPAVSGSRAGAAVADPPETLVDAPDWRGLLDVLEARSGQDLTDLWREWVVRPDELPLLDARASARASYARTLALAGDWRLPRVIRDALRAWEFETAEALMADARTVIAQRDAVAELAVRADAGLPTTTQALFESGSLAEASAHAEAQRAALLAIETAEASRSAEDDILSRIGMIGEHPEQSLRGARLLLAQDDFEGSLAASDRALRAWTVAWEEGRRRALLGLAVLATVLVLATAALGHVRRARRQPSLEPASWPAATAPAAQAPRVPQAAQAPQAPSAAASPTARPLRAPQPPPVRPGSGRWPGDA
jgi:hypothetical protein